MKVAVLGAAGGIGQALFFITEVKPASRYGFSII